MKNINLDYVLGYTNGNKSRNRRSYEFLFKTIDKKFLERSMTAKDSEILKKLKSGYDLSSEEKKELEELIDNLI